MKQGLKIYGVYFEGVYPVGNCCVLAANSLDQAEAMAKETITHTDVIEVCEITIDEPKIIIYIDGDY